MKDFLKAAGVMLGIILAILAIASIFGGFNLFASRVGGKYAEETRTQIYEESRTYNQAMALDIAQMCDQWRTAEDEIAKNSIAATIKQRVGRYDETKLPPRQQRCVDAVYGY